VSTALGSTPALHVHVFTSSPVDYHPEVHDFGRQQKCDDRLLKFCEGTRHSGARGLEKQILVRIIYISRSYCLLLVEYASVQVWKTSDSVREGIGPSDGGCFARNARFRLVHSIRYCKVLSRYASVRVWKTRDSVREGIGPSKA